MIFAPDNTGSRLLLRRRSSWLTGVAFAAMLASSGGFTQGASATTIEQALSSAYRYNPRIDAERARLRATDEELARANSGYRPTLSGSADVAYNRTDIDGATNNSSTAVSNPRGYGVTASQALFRGFRTQNQVREAEAGVRAGRETLRAIEQTVLLDAATSYMDVIRDTQILRIRENNVNVLTRELRATQERFAVGEVTRTDVAQAEAQRAAATAELELARANLRNSRAAFERHVGTPPNGLSEPKPLARLLPKSLDEASAIASKEHPLIIGALYREQAARSTVDRTWGELLPEVRLETSHNRRFDPSGTVDRSATTQVQARATIPLYDGGEVRARIRGTKHTHVSRIQEIEQNRADIQANVVQTWSSLQAFKARLLSNQAAVASFRTALAGVREEEKVGQRTLLDVLNAEQALLNAEVSLVTTQRDVVVGSYSVMSAVGRLSAGELMVADQIYDPAIHANEVRRKWWGISITHSDGKREHHDFWERLGKIFHHDRGGWDTSMK